MQKENWKINKLSQAKLEIEIHKLSLAGARICAFCFVPATQYSCNDVQRSKLSAFGVYAWRLLRVKTRILKICVSSDGSINVEVVVADVRIRCW